ncbi:MAG: VWA domain-containing protein, partial [Lachnospiraceae bacterium]|nr:VWA domain-containing protein [Lachnospiraceae bacterium]
MGKRVKHLLAAAILAACLLAQTGVCYGDETAAQNGQAAGESQTDQNSQTTAVQNGQETGDVNPPAIEQVYVNLPEVTVYGSGWPEEGMEAFLGQESLTYEGKTTFAQTGEPVYYYILLDVSNSMPDSYFRGVKEAIRSFEGKINAQDRMALYTFGETVELKLAEEHSPEETRAVLESLANKDERTLMFEAVRMASDRAAQVAPEVCRRRVLLVISDGEDFNIGSTGVNEAQECLKKTGIPAYAFAMKDTAREHINSFGEFARTSGGTLTVFDDQQAPSLLDTFPAYMAAGEVLEWRSGSNRQTNRMENVSLRTGDNRTVSREVMVSRHIRDEEAPRLVFAEQTGDAQIAVEFSEAVEGADNPSSYVITRRDLKKSKKKKDKDSDKDDKDKEDQEEE